MPIKPKKGEYTTYNVDAKTFVTVWQESSSVKDVVWAEGNSSALFVFSPLTGQKNVLICTPYSMASVVAIQ